MENKTFKAPTEELEQQIIEFCLNVLGFALGGFWYKWFTSNNPDNATVHICCCSSGYSEMIRKEFASLPFVESVYKVTECNTPHEEEPYMYHVHFKLKQPCQQQ